MNPHDDFFSPQGRYSLGTDEDSGAHYLSIPVSTGVVDYEEHYRLSPAEFARLLEHPPDAAAFADECRARTHDDRLIQTPGWNRGTPV